MCLSVLVRLSPSLVHLSSSKFIGGRLCSSRDILSFLGVIELSVEWSGMGFSSLVISLFRAHCQSNSIIQIDRRERVKINHTKQLKMCKKCCVCFAGGTSQGSQCKMIKCSKCSKSSGGTSQGDPNDSLTEEDCREGSGELGLLISSSLSHFDWDY